MVAHDGKDSHKVLEKTFDWQHARALEVGKWSLAAASGLVVAVVVVALRQPSEAAVQTQPWRIGPLALDLSWTWSALVALLAGVLISVGVAAFRSAARTQTRYILAQNLLARLQDIRPFLKLATEQADRE
ncbi:hypothetical protein [Brevundimonas sp.]|uniref:hypothetical protein n=1 Tax=Brevundimonas sp. TaxID=1871086 RepID=UPI0025BA4B43|nr:hypothetical protein [Brevundimonas sp.]